MGNRILLGNRSTGGYGLYVSRDGDNVLTTTSPLAFDSRAGNSPTIFDAGQGEILSSDSSGTDTITHNLGYKPLFAVRWNTADELSGGVATKVFDPRYSHMITTDNAEGFPDITLTPFGIQVSITTSSLQILRFAAPSTIDIYYAYIIFREEDFTGGLGL
tara:strand:+ start:1477 stop:1956 length:480 start_codon:yes stop_codon:yes gene_type:complete